MAKIKLSAIGITNISGKAGGTVFSRNKGGSYAKNFVVPSNVITDARQAVRSVFGNLASAWRSLTEIQRKSFAEQAPFYLKLDVFSDLKQLSPMALYQKLNIQLATAGLPPISTCLPPAGTNAIKSQASPTVVTNATSIAFAFDLGKSNATPANEYVLEATPPVSPSINNVTKLYRVLGASNQNGGATPPLALLKEEAFAATPAALYQLYKDKFTEPEVGAKVCFRIKAVNPDTGENSAYWYFNAITV